MRTDDCEYAYLPLIIAQAASIRFTFIVHVAAMHVLAMVAKLLRRTNAEGALVHAFGPTIRVTARIGKDITTIGWGDRSNVRVFQLKMCNYRGGLLSTGSQIGRQFLCYL